MSDEGKPVVVVAVAVGGKFCDCGGMFEVEPKITTLLSIPTKVKLVCPFCGETDFAPHPYNVKISFRVGGMMADPKTHIIKADSNHVNITIHAEGSITYHNQNVYIDKDGNVTLKPALKISGATNTNQQRS